MEQLVPELIDEQLVYRGAARDAELAAEFLRRFPPSGDIVIHGAGTHTARILPLLESLDGVRIVGIADKLADTFDGFHGYEVFLPEDVASRSFDSVLLSNELWEMQMRATLLQSGVPSSKIRGIYSDERYRDAAAARHANVVDEVSDSGCDFALVDFCRSHQHIIEDKTLARILTPERTLRFYSQRFGEADEDGIYRSIGFRNSLDLLGALLQRARPDLVYLRTFVEDNLAAALVRRFLPDARIVHEAYDWAVTVEPYFLKQVHGHTDHSIHAAMAGELYSLREAEFMVSKRGGPSWQHVLAGATAEHASYFPQLTAHDRVANEVRASDDAVRVVYAGNLPSPNTLDIDMVGALFPFFERMTRAAEVRVSVFNGSHRGVGDDARFAHYMQFESERLVYHRAKPYAEVLREIDAHDYGWLYFPRDGIDFIDELVLISNKFTGYISAGIPVIIDDGWEYMAELVERFDAGIVHSMHAPDELPGRLERARVEAHRRGAEALRAHLMRSNETVVERLRTLVHAS